MRILGGSAFYDLIGPPGPQGDPGPVASWDVIPDKPNEFPPAAHEQEIDTITGLRDALLEIAAGGGVPVELEARLSTVEAARIISAALQAGVVNLVRADGTTIALPVAAETPSPETGWVISTSPGIIAIHGMPEVPEIRALVEPKTIIIEGYNG